MVVGNVNRGGAQVSFEADGSGAASAVLTTNPSVLCWRRRGPESWKARVSADQSRLIPCRVRCRFAFDALLTS